jgi:hypothetical protein
MMLISVDLPAPFSPNMMHRLREAMRTGGLAPMGGASSIVEIDETFIGRKEGAEVRRGGAHKNVVLSLIERGGEARSFHLDSTEKISSRL